MNLKPNMEKGAWFRRSHFSWFAPMLALVLALTTPVALGASEAGTLEVGLAEVDITPETPIWLAGYAAREHPSEMVDHKLMAQAMALRDEQGERFVFVALDNCEVSEAFTRPVLQELEEQEGLAPGRVMIVSSHTHSAPVLAHTLETMYAMPPEDREQVKQYSKRLQEQLVKVVGQALADFEPAQLLHGTGRATFAMNRRVYREDGMAFGENPDGPVDWEVPVLKVLDSDGNVRAVMFGYACHGTSIAGDDFYVVSGDFMAYAREQIEDLYPGAMALYMTGMGADSNPSPRGRLVDAKRHGTELAGAVIGVLNRPMRPVEGPLDIAYKETELPLTEPPSREQLEQDAESDNRHIRERAKKYLTMLENGESLPEGVSLPAAAIRLGDDLTFVAVGGEVVVDYAIDFKRLFASGHPWLIGYAYEVPCYIPSIRILKEGGYEADYSMIYYGYYGPFHGRVETILVQTMQELVGEVGEN